MCARVIAASWRVPSDFFGRIRERVLDRAEKAAAGLGCFSIYSTHQARK